MTDKGRKIPIKIVKREEKKKTPPVSTKPKVESSKTSIDEKVESFVMPPSVVPAIDKASKHARTEKKDETKETPAEKAKVKKSFSLSVLIPKKLFTKKKAKKKQEKKIEVGDEAKRKEKGRWDSFVSKIKGKTSGKDKESANGIRTTKRSLFMAKLSIKELVHFAKRLSFLSRSGIPVLESLQILIKQTKSRSRKKIFQVIESDVANGRTLSEGLARFRESFGDFAISVVRIGEMSGTLPQNLKYLGEELQKRHALRRKIIGALVYPAFITVATFSVAILLTVYIFPKVMPIFISLNVTLPFTTKTLLFISNFLRDHGLVLFGVLTLVSVVFIILIRKVRGIHFFVARTLLRLPIIGSLLQNYNMTNFCRTSGLLLRSGFQSVEATEVTAESTPNPVFKEEIKNIHTRLVKGERMSGYLQERAKLFPDTVYHMVSIGEESGTLSDTLMYLAEHYEGEVDDTVKNLSSSIEPVLMVFMGLIVGFVAVSVITPIYEVTQHLQR